MRKLNYAFALGLLPLLGAGSHQSALTVSTAPPKCGATEFLSTQGGALSCTTVTGGSLQLPNCLAQGQLLTHITTGDVGGGFSCTPKGMGNVGDLTSIKSILDQATIDITNLETNPPAGINKFRGVTQLAANKSSGKFALAGAEVGYASAAAFCAAEYAGSHMCSAYDLYLNVAAGNITTATKIAKSWLFFPAWNTPVAAPQNANDGVSDDCGSGTYPTGDRHWTGMAVEWGVNPLATTNIGFRFIGGTDTPCSQVLPFSCCGG